MRPRLLLRSLCKLSAPTPNRESGLYGRLPPTVDIHSHLLCYSSLRPTAETWLLVRKWVCSKKAPWRLPAMSRMRVCLDATHHSTPAPPYWAVPLPGLDMREEWQHADLFGAFLVHTLSVHYLFLLPLSSLSHSCVHFKVCAAKSAAVYAESLTLYVRCPDSVIAALLAAYTVPLTIGGSFGSLLQYS